MANMAYQGVIALLADAVMNRAVRGVELTRLGKGIRMVPILSSPGPCSPSFKVPQELPIGSPVLLSTMTRLMQLYHGAQLEADRNPRGSDLIPYWLSRNTSMALSRRDGASVMHGVAA